MGVNKGTVSIKMPNISRMQPRKIQMTWMNKSIPTRPTEVQ